MKAKNNAQYLMQLVQSESYSNSKFELIKRWNIAEIDYRVMFNFKNALYGSPQMSEQNQIPVSEFVRIRSEFESPQIKDQICGTEEALLRELKDSKTGLIDLNSFSDLVDLFMFMPNTEKLNDQQRSPDLFQVLSSNTRNKATADNGAESENEIHLRRAMEFVWIRIQERFNYFSPAFRFMDKSMKGRVTFD